MLKGNGIATVDLSSATLDAISGADGWCDLTLTTSFTDTIGELVVVFQDASIYLPVVNRFQVIEENVYVAVYAASGALGTDVASILTDTGTTLQAELDGIQADTEDLQTQIGTAGVGLSDLGGMSTAMKAEVEVEANDALVDEGLDHLIQEAVIGANVTDNSIIADLVSSSATSDYDTFVNTDDSLQAISDTGGGGPTVADIADGVWDELRSGHTGGTTFGGGVLVEDINTAAKASVNAEADGAIVTAHLDHLLQVDYDPASQPGVATALLNELIESNGGVSRYTTGALAQGPSSGLTVDGIADQVWDEARSGHVGAGSYGEGVLVEDLNTVAMASVNSEVDQGIQDAGLDHLVAAPVIGSDVADDSIIAFMVSASATADWDDLDNTTDSLEALDHTIMKDDGVASYNRSTDSLQAIADGGGGPTVGAIADGVWDELRGDHTTTLTFGSELTEYDPPTNAELATEINDVQSDIGALNDISTGQVNTEVMDVLTVDTSTLPVQGAPPVTPTFEQMITWIYKTLRNKVTQTSTTWSLYDDAGSTVDSKRTVSDDGATTTLSEIETGP